MNDLIRRQEILDVLAQAKRILNKGNEDGYQTDYVKGLTAVENLIKNEPTVAAVPKISGKWLKGNSMLFPVYKCSNCKVSTMLGKTRFCPYCGADMREKEK